MFSPGHIAYHDRSPQEHSDFMSAHQGWFPSSLSMYGSPSAPLYAAVWIERPPWEKCEHAIFLKGSEAELSTAIADAKRGGLFPLHIAATSDGPYTSGASALYTAIFQKANDPRDLDFSVNLPYPKEAFDDACKKAALARMYPSSVCAFGRQTTQPGGHRYVAVFRPQPAARRISWHWQEWSAAEAQQFLDAAAAGMFRPTMLTPILGADGSLQSYSVVLRDDSLVDWNHGSLDRLKNSGFNCGVSPSDVLNGMSGDEYKAFRDLAPSTNGWVLEVAAAGIPNVGPGPRFVALVAPYPHDRPFPRQWTIARAGSTVVSPSPSGGSNPNIPTAGNAGPHLPGSVGMDDPLAAFIPKALDPWDDFMARIMVVDDVRGAQLAVVRGAKLAVLRAYTNAEKSYPVVKHTDCFRLASVSKVLTAMAILRLAGIEAAAQNAPLETLLDTHIAKRWNLPSSTNPPVERQYLQEVTVDQLITYKSGINSGPPPILGDLAKPLTIASIVDAFKRVDDLSLQQDWSREPDKRLFSFEPGTSSVYENFPFVLAQAIVETSPWGMKYIDFTRNHILNGLHLYKAHRAENTLEQAQAADEVLFHSRQPLVSHSAQDVPPAQGNVLRPSNYNFPHDISGAGGWAMPAVELARLLAAIEREFTAPSSTSLKPAETKLLLMPFEMNGKMFGRGWDTILELKNLNGAHAYHKNGGGPGCSAVIYYRPAVLESPSMAFVVVFNKDLEPSHSSEDMVKQLEAIAASMKPNDWPTEDLFDEFIK